MTNEVGGGHDNLTKTWVDDSQFKDRHPPRQRRQSPIGGWPLGAEMLGKGYFSTCDTSRTAPLAALVVMAA